MPDKVVQLPDGKVVSFPDSMADADISAVIKKQMAPSAPPPAMEDANRSGFFAAKGGMATPPPVPTTAELGKEAPFVASGLASAFTGGLPLLARAGIGAAAAGGASALSGSDAAGTAKDAALFGAGPEVGGSVLGKVGEGLSSMASKSLARILRLTPKSFQFGREPAQEVLERGLTSGNMETMAASIGQASKDTTAQLNDVLKASKGTINAENLANDVANSMPSTAGNRFQKVVEDALATLKLRSNQLSNLSASDANALKQEIAKQGKFVEGDMRASVGNAIKQFGGKLKDNIITIAPDAEDLLHTSANLTEASKGADLALRTEKAGRSSGGLKSFDLKKPATYVRPITDTPTGAQTMFHIANMLKDTVGASAAVRTAFKMVFGDDEN